MRIGIPHLALGTDKPEEVFARAARAGAEGVEFQYPTAAAAAALDRSDHAHRLAALAAETGLAVPSLSLGCLRAEPALIGRPDAVQRWQRVISGALTAAAEAGAKVLDLPFFGKNAIETEEEFTRAADALMALVDSAAEAGVVLGIESTLPFHQQEYLLGHLGNTGDVKVYYNTAVALARKFDVATGIRQLGLAAIVQVRFSDVRIADSAPPDYDVPLGGGNVDFRATAQALRAVGYDGWIIVEPPGDEQALADPVGSAQAAVEFARRTLQDAAA